MPILLDLAALLDGERAERAGEVIVVRVASGKLLGLLVDSLGEIPQIDTDSVLPVADQMALTDRMVRGERPDSPLLLILNVERVVAAMGG